MPDIRYALRTMRRTPGLTIIALLSLALGIGANTAIFTLINTVILRSLPVRDPASLVEPLHRFPGEPHLNGFSWAKYRYYIDNNHVFSALIGTLSPNPPSPTPPYFNVKLDQSDAGRIDGVYVTGNYFPVLGLNPALGRLIVPQDDRADAPATVAVVSWSFWQDRFSLNRSIVGKRILVDDVPVTIIGVASRDFYGLRIDHKEHIWLPMALQPVMNPRFSYTGPRGNRLTLVGRLKPGVSLDHARAEMAVLYRQSNQQDTSAGARFLRVMTFEMEPAGAGLSGVRDQYGRPLVILMAIVGVLLLIACTNIAGLLLARGETRLREIAVRISLGATRSRLLRQVLTESLLLSVAATLLGIFVAYAGTRVLLRIIDSGREPIHLQVVPDIYVLLFAAAVACLAALLFGWVPAIRASGVSPASSMRDAGRSGDTPRRRLFGRALVAAQVALSLVLLAAAGLLLGHLSSIYSGLGFQRNHVLLVKLDSTRSGLRGAQLARPYRDLLDRFSTIPGVRSATLSGVTPVQGAGANRDATVEGYQAKPGELRYITENWVAPRYFETFGMPLLMGRDFSFEDEGRSRVAIINQTMALYFFGVASPLGKHVLFDGDTKPYEIIGVAADARYSDAKEPIPRTIFFNAFQLGLIFDQFSLRTATSPAAIAADVRRTVGETLKNISVDRITTMTDQVDASIVPERLIVTLSSLFGALGLLLAGIGIYGLLAYTVARRVHEIGIRLALGATRHKVIRMVLTDALATVLAGLMIGIPVALSARRFAASLIPGLHATVGIPLLFGSAAMLLIALLAAWLPAHRAGRLDPMQALRHD
jgi:predicted permease